MTNENNILERLAIMADILQIANYQLNITEVSNDDIMKALELQNKKYLEKIILILENYETKSNNSKNMEI